MKNKTNKTKQKTNWTWLRKMNEPPPLEMRIIVFMFYVNILWDVIAWKILQTSQKVSFFFLLQTIQKDVKRVKMRDRKKNADKIYKMHHDEMLYKLIRFSFEFLFFQFFCYFRWHYFKDLFILVFKIMHWKSPYAVAIN